MDGVLFVRAKDNCDRAGLEVTEQASAARSEGGRPGKPCQDCRNASIRAMPATLTNCVRCPAERAVHWIIEPGQKIFFNVDPVCG